MPKKNGEKRADECRALAYRNAPPAGGVKERSITAEEEERLTRAAAARGMSLDEYLQQGQTLIVYFTAEEVESLTQAAADCGTSLDEYIRLALDESLRLALLPAGEETKKGFRT